jgi:hypothetical protein
LNISVSQITPQDGKTLPGGPQVELRFFGGLNERETADVLGISLATLKRDWNFARVWLLRQLRSSPRDPS